VEGRGWTIAQLEATKGMACGWGILLILSIKMNTFIRQKERQNNKNKEKYNKINYVRQSATAHAQH